MRLLWSSDRSVCAAADSVRDYSSSVTDADITAAVGTLWIAAATRQGTVDVMRVAPSRRLQASGGCEVVRTCRGRSPRLAALRGDRLVLVLQEPVSEGQWTLVSRGLRPDGSEWRSPAPVGGRPGDRLGTCGRLFVTARGTIVLPTTWITADPDSHEVRCLLSEDGGVSWFEGAGLPDHRTADPAAIELGDDRLLLTLGTPPGLRAHESTDALRTVNAARDLQVDAEGGSYALVECAAGLAVVWAKANNDTTIAPPSVPNIRCAYSTDAGVSWRAAQPLPLRPGFLPGLRSGVRLGRGLALLVEQRRGPCSSWSCVAWDPANDEAARRRARAGNRYRVDSEGVRLALLVLTSHTIDRPGPSRRLFVEAYFMRSLVAAEAVLGEEAPERLSWYEPGSGLERAIDWADSLVAAQPWGGFWKLGYDAEWYADMAAAVALYPALEAHVDTARAARYERSAARFLRGLDRERMWLPNGAVGVGRAIVIDPIGRGNCPKHEPYLVSTALAGIAVPAWLYRRTGNPLYRDRALAALDYTLSQITDDGFAEALGRQEGSQRIAAYVEEGWMAADTYLADAKLRRRLRAALRPHVDWLLRVQRDDGTWDGEGSGGFARTPAIVDFLIWYDQKCEPRADVRKAVERASRAFVDPDFWRAWGLYRADADHEVLRALAGRPMAALAAARPVQ